MALLECRNLTKHFGHFLAIDDCSTTVEEGSITGLIGPNGAGKTTMFNIVAGAFQCSSGTIVYNGEDITATIDGHALSQGFSTNLSDSARIPTLDRDREPDGRSTWTAR